MTEITPMVEEISNILKSKLQVCFNTIQNKLQVFLSKTPLKIKTMYEHKINKLQKQATQAYDVWYQFEIDFNKLKQKGFKDKFHKKSMYYQRKILRMEYKSVLNSFSLLLLSIKNNI